MSAPENPPAFPVSEVRDAYGQGLVEGSSGMTLRDWFAGQALTGILSDPNVRDTVAVLAEGAYLVADAMLAERAKAVS